MNPDQLVARYRIYRSAVIAMAGVSLGLYLYSLTGLSRTQAWLSDVGLVERWDLFVIFFLIVPLITLVTIQGESTDARLMVQRSTLSLLSGFTSVALLLAWHNDTLTTQMAWVLLALGYVLSLLVPLGIGEYFIKLLAKNHGKLTEGAQVLQIVIRNGMVSVAGFLALVGSFIIASILTAIIFAIGKFPLYTTAFLAVVLVLTFGVLMLLVPKALQKAFKAVPLEDPELQEHLQNVATHFGYKKPVSIWVIPTLGERAANAFQVGLEGLSSRVFLYETLLDSSRFTLPEVEAVLAHELTHAKKRHAVWLTVLGLSLIVGAKELALRLAGSSVGVELLLDIPFLTAVFFGIAFFERKCEFQADQGAAKRGYGAALISSLDTLTGKERELKTYPKALYAALSHPDFSTRKSYILSQESTAGLE